MGEREACPDRVCRARDGVGRGDWETAWKSVNFHMGCGRSEKELAGEVARSKGFNDNPIVWHVVWESWCLTVWIKKKGFV